MKNKVFLIGTVAILLLLPSCKSERKNKNNEIPIESIDKKLIYRGENIAESITNSFNDEKGVENLFAFKHFTPILYAGIKRYKVAFEESYIMLNLILGELSSPKLIKVVSKPNLKSMQYSLKSSQDDISSVTLILDFNVDNNLANFYLKVTSKDGKLNNRSVLPKVYIKF